MNKKIIAGLLSLMIIGTSATAQTYIDCNISDSGVVTIENQTENSGKTAKVSIVVYNPGKSFEDLKTDQNAAAVLRQTSTDSSGNYKFEFRLGDEAGFYNAEVTSEFSENPEVVTFFYAPTTGAEAALAELKNCSGSEQTYNFLYGENEGWKKLGFFLPLGSQPSDTKKLSDIIYEGIKTNTLPDTVSEAVTYFKKASVAELLNENVSLGTEQLEKYLWINELDFNEEYNASFMSDEAKKQIFEGIKNKNIKSIQDCDEKILEQVILKTVKFADGYGRISDILSKYSSYTDIDPKKYTNVGYQSVLGNDYSDYSALKSALDKTISSSDKETGGGSSTGSTKRNNVSTGDINMSGTAPSYPTPTPVEKKYFGDIDNYAWAKEAINYLAKNKIVSGKAENEYSPADNITREEFTTLIVRAFGLSETQDDITFSDVADDAWYAETIKKASAAKIVTGREDGSFGVGESITRQDAAVIIARVLKLSEIKTPDKFSDDPEIAGYARQAIYAMREKGIISGYENGSFQPYNYVTRAEAAVIIYNAITK